MLVTLWQIYYKGDSNSKQYWPNAVSVDGLRGCWSKMKFRTGPPWLPLDAFQYMNFSMVYCTAVDSILRTFPSMLQHS